MCNATLAAINVSLADSTSSGTYLVPSHNSYKGRNGSTVPGIAIGYRGIREMAPKEML